jgi:hypothetical protein
MYVGDDKLHLSTYIVAVETYNITYEIPMTSAIILQVCYGATKYLQNSYGTNMVSTHLRYLQLCCQKSTTLLPNIYTSMVSTDLLPYIYGSLQDLQFSMVTMASTGISRIC